MKILITGGTGMLGNALKEFFPKATYLQGRQDMDLSKPSVIEKIKSLPDYDIIIHCAAFTNLSYCDEHLEDAMFLHGKVVPVLQSKCKRLIYISTNPTDSNRVYYVSKRLGEKNTLVRKEDLVIRVNIYGNKGLTEWGLSKLRNREVLTGYTNVIFNPVSVRQLSNYIYNNTNIHTGIINVGTIGAISKYDFLKLVANINKEDDSLIQPTLHKGVSDLTVPLVDQFIGLNLSDGLLDLFKN